jgi:hypothetical protein
MREKVYAINEESIFMNHVEEGSYVICQTYKEAVYEWREVCCKISGVEWRNSGCNLLLGTKYVRILAMLNYNSGHP